MGAVARRYRLTERLAATAMSEVWVAHDLELDRPVALKRLGRDADPERFDREARAAAGLSHPNICRLFDYGEADGSRFMVFELLPGGSLEDRLSAGRPLPDAEAMRIARQLAAALAYAHAAGVVHRDVKPANVLFDDEGNAKLADFGIARVTDAATLTEAGTVLGTAAYLSPEQASGEAVGPPADVYAFGLILYRMLTGRLPFEAGSALELASMHVTREPIPIESLRADATPELAGLAMRALAKRPEDRPRDGSALLAELGTVVEEETQVIARGVRRRLRPRYVAAGVGLTVLAFAGAGIAVLATPETSDAPVTTGREETRRATTRGGTTPTPSATTATTAPTTAPSGTTAPTTTAVPTAPPVPPTTAPAPAPAPDPVTTETLPTDTVETTTTTDATTTVATGTTP